MINPKELDTLITRLASLIIQANSIQHQHNTMLMDLYERIAKLETLGRLKGTQ